MTKTRRRDPTFLRVVLLATLVGLCIPFVVPSFSKGGEARDRKARVDVKNLTDAVGAYRRRHGQMPPSLRDLLIRDGNREPCIDELPIDPWDRDYELREDCVVSAGPDGVFGDEDDVLSRTIKH